MKQSWKTEIPAVSVALVVLFACLFLLWRDSHAADEGGRKVGAITYRFRIAQSRDGGSVLWRDLDLNSPVYNNNYVRTDAASEAVVTLNDRTRIELEPDSMIVLQVSDERVRVRLDRGSVLLRRGKSGGRALSIAGNAGRETSVPLDSPDLRVDAQGKNIRIAPRANAIMPLTPGDNLRLFTDKADATVDFAWEEKGRVRLEVSSARDMRSIARQRMVVGGRARLRLKQGFHYWRIRSGEKASVPRRIRVVRKTKLTVDEPRDGRTFSYSLRPPLVGFAWSADRLALSYVVRVARDSAMRETTAVIRAYRTGISRAFPAGTYYWRVETEGVLPGSETTSPVRRFIVRETPVSLRPELVAPGDGMVFDQAAVTKEGILFRWRAGSDVKRVTLRISKDRPDGAALLSPEVRDNHHRTGKNLKPGKYYWRLRVRGRDGDVFSRSSTFRVVDRKASTTPSAKPPATKAPTRKQVVNPYLARPRVIFPRNRSVVDMSKLDSINFRWRAVPGASSYSFTLYRRGRVVHRTTTRRPRLRFTDLSKLDTGLFSWRVIAKPATNSGKRASRTSASFRISLSDGPDKPSFK